MSMLPAPARWSLVASAALFAVGAMVVSLLRAVPSPEEGRTTPSSPLPPCPDFSALSGNCPRVPGEAARREADPSALLGGTGGVGDPAAPGNEPVPDDPLSGTADPTGEALVSTAPSPRSGTSQRGSGPPDPAAASPDGSGAGGGLLGPISKVGPRVEARDAERDTLTVEQEPPSAKKEKEFYEAFLALQKKDPEILERSASEVLQSADPDCKKVALLRALYETRPEGAIDSFVLAVTTLPDKSDLPLESVSSFALRFLCERSGKDRYVRSALERQVWGGSASMTPDRRSQAAAALFAAASAEELPGLTSRLWGERDPRMLEGAAAGLRANSSDPELARRTLESLPVVPPPEVTPGSSEE